MRHLTFMTTLSYHTHESKSSRQRLVCAELAVGQNAVTGFKGQLNYGCRKLSTADVPIFVDQILSSVNAMISELCSTGIMFPKEECDVMLRWTECWVP